MTWDKKNHCGDADCEGWPGCGCRTPEFWVEYERNRLRRLQAVAVMPQIGPLLDAWEQLPNDLIDKINAENPALCSTLCLIRAAMEDVEA